jgi:hypothetical protein
MSLLYYTFMDKTSLPPAVKHAGCATLVAGILAQSGGFFLHMVKGQPNRASIGTTVTTIRAILLTCTLPCWCMGCLPRPKGANGRRLGTDHRGHAPAKKI